MKKLLAMYILLITGCSDNAEPISIKNVYIDNSSVCVELNRKLISYEEGKILFDYHLKTITGFTRNVVDNKVYSVTCDSKDKVAYKIDESQIISPKTIVSLEIDLKEACDQESCNILDRKKVNNINPLIDNNELIQVIKRCNIKHDQLKGKYLGHVGKLKSNQGNGTVRIVEPYSNGSLQVHLTNDTLKEDIEVLVIDQKINTRGWRYGSYTGWVLVEPINTSTSYWININEFYPVNLSECL